ncbi:MAG: GNAT family N-acetyltransferase [Microthrixaceae bacterium]
MGDPTAPSTWSADVVLRDGQTVHVRPIRPDDAEALVRFHERQSPESVYLRFFSPRPQLSAREVAYFTQVDHRDRVAFVATVQDELVGVARYERYRGTDTAEVAFFIDDDHHGRGMATMFLEYLAAAGRANHLQRFTASTLPSNRRMLAVFSRAGYDVVQTFDDGVVEVAFDLTATTEVIERMDSRERAAAAATARNVLEPRSVAVVPGVRDLGVLCAGLASSGYRGDVHVVGATALGDERFASWSSVDDVAELPEGIDLALVDGVGLDDATVRARVVACAERSVAAVAVLGGAPGDEPAHPAWPRGVGTRVLGPGVGMIANSAPDAPLTISMWQVRMPTGATSFWFSSPALAAAVAQHGSLEHLGYATAVVGAGSADVAPADFLSFWSEHEPTRAVLIQVDPDELTGRFIRSARAASHRIPVAVFSPNRVADADVVLRAVARQTGVMVSDRLSSWIDLARVLERQPVPSGRGVAVVGRSAALVDVAADACRRVGLRVLVFPDLDELEAAAAKPSVASVLVVANAFDRDPSVLDTRLAAAVAAAPEVAFVLVDPSAERAGERRNGVVPIFDFPEEAASVLGQLARHADWRRVDRARGRGVRPVPLDLDAARAAAPAADADLEAQDALLAAYGVEVAHRHVVDSIEGAAAAAAELGWPVTLKAARRDPTTRSVRGGVALDLDSDAAVRAAAERLRDELGGDMFPLIVQRFVEEGVDASVRLRRLPGGLTTVEVGAGGPARALAEPALGVVPLSLADASALVAESPVGRLLSDPLDRVPLVSLVYRLGLLVEDVESIGELVADPVVCSASGAQVADLLVAVDADADAAAPQVRRLD